MPQGKARRHEAAPIVPDDNLKGPPNVSGQTHGHCVHGVLTAFGTCRRSMSAAMSFVIFLGVYSLSS